MSIDALSTVEKLQRENARLKKKCAEHADERQRLRVRIASLRNADHRKRAADAEAKLADAKETIEDLRAIVREQQAEIARIIKAHAMRERYGK